MSSFIVGREYEEDGAEKRIAPDIFVVFGTSKEDRVSYTV
jgi:hypothetical protein